jgi:pilus assembly protein CpaE
MSSISVVVIDPEQGSRKEIEKLLKDIDHVTLAGVAEDMASGYEMVVRSKPMVVIMEIDTDPEQAFDLIGQITKNYPGTCVFATSADTSSDTILKAMRSGCTEYILRPVAVQDLMNSLGKVGRLMVQRPAAPVTEKGKIISCFSPKGGVGNTTVATNLAVSLHQASQKPVVLVDLDLEGGDTTMFLNLKTKYTISDVTTNITRLDQAFLQGVLSKHSSGIYLLAEPQRVEEAETITPGQVREVLDLLKTMFSYVVVDTEIGYGERNLAAFDAADLILLVGILSLPSLKNIQKALDVFVRLGYDTNKVKLVINRHLRKGEISSQDAEKALNYKAFLEIPNDYNNVMSSINRGMPLTLFAPHSDISRSFKELANQARLFLSDTSKRRALV